MSSNFAKTVKHYLDDECYFTLINYNFADLMTIIAQNLLPCILITDKYTTNLSACVNQYSQNYKSGIVWYCFTLVSVAEKSIGVASVFNKKICKS